MEEIHQVDDRGPPLGENETASDGDRLKKTYVLGVVDTTGMKCPNSNRKRRWDQPPDGPPEKLVNREEVKECVDPVMSDSVEEKVELNNVVDNVPSVSEPVPVVEASEPPKNTREGVVVQISDSLKQIQFCYDAEDSSGEEDEVNNVVEPVQPTNNVDSMTPTIPEEPTTNAVAEPEKEEEQANFSFKETTAPTTEDNIDDNSEQSQSSVEMAREKDFEKSCNDLSSNDSLEQDFADACNDLSEEVRKSLDERPNNIDSEKQEDSEEAAADDSMSLDTFVTTAAGKMGLLSMTREEKKSETMEGILNDNVKTANSTDPTELEQPKTSVVPTAEVNHKDKELNGALPIKEEEEKLDGPEWSEVKKSPVEEPWPEVKDHVEEPWREANDVEEPKNSDVPLLRTVPQVEPKRNFFPGADPVEAPKLSPITLRIYKDNLSIRTDLDSPKRKSPSLSSELRSQLSPHLRSPGRSSSLSPQTKQLEFTLKIAKDATTNYPKATMSPKSKGSPTGVWKSEVQIDGISPKSKDASPVLAAALKKAPEVETPKEEVPLDDLKTSGAQISSLFKKMLEGDLDAQNGAVFAPAPEVPILPAPRKRGRPRKIRVLPPPEPEGFSVSAADEAANRPMRTCRGRTKPIVTKQRKPRGGMAGGLGIQRSSGSVSPTEGIAPPAPTRGRGALKQSTPDRETLSAREKAEIEKIEARKERLKQERLAKVEAKKAKKLAKKLKDEERRKRLAREKAEAAAPHVFEEETRMSAPESGSRGHTPAPSRLAPGDHGDESQNSISNTPSSSHNKRGRMEISIMDMDCLVNEVKVHELAEYQWQGSELHMIQEQVSLYLGVKSFKRKYPALKRRVVEAEERTFLEDSGLVPKSMCDLGLTAVSSAEILDIMFHDFPEKYEEFRRHVREKQAREASYKQKAIALQRKDGSKVEPREQALEAVASWNANLNRERREERRCALDLQTFTVHYPKAERETMTRPKSKVGLYPVAVIPGQYCDYYKTYTPTELMYFPLNTVLYGPLKPNERHVHGSDDGSGSDSDDTTSSDDSSDSSSESDSDADESPSVPHKCSLCSGDKTNKPNQSEDLLQCAQCQIFIHPSCNDLTPEMVPHILKSKWHCSNCKKCSKCNESPTNKDKLMNCHLCDRGYHLNCIGLKKFPEGRWHCTICSYCSSCGSKNPAGPDWQHEFKKGEKGVKMYQRTLCTPCFKML